ncbi:MAG: DUF1573 domain-containing protein [bacterium]
MRRIILIALNLLLISSILIYSKPKMVFECGRTYDWGKVKPKDSPLKADIKIYNKGKDTLEIKRVKPMCGCTTAPLSKKTLPPGDSAVLKVTLNIEHYEGVVNKKISFTTNEMNSESFLEITANVFQPITLFPNRYLNFSRMYTNNESITKLVINNISDHDISLKNVIVKPEDLKINLKTGDIIPKDSSFVLEARAIPTALGQFNCRVELSFDDPDQQEIIISGWGKVDPESEKPVDNAKPVTETIDSTTKDNPPVSPATIIPENRPIQIQPGNNINIQQNPNLPVVPLTPQNQGKIESPTNILPIKVEPVKNIQIGQPVEISPVEEPEKEKKK